MAPKKSKELVSHSIQQTTDHELFLQAFEKPTQIYRYLKTRLQNRPLFLTRNLSYMKHRMSRSHSRRKSFSLNSMLDRAKEKCLNLVKTSKDYLNISYLGYFDKNADDHQIKVETMLVKICQEKRKDIKSPLLTESVGTLLIPVNPDEDISVPKVWHNLSINANKFNVNPNSNLKSIHLVISVCKDETKVDTTNSLCLNNNGQPHTVRYLLGACVQLYEKHRFLMGDSEFEMPLQECASVNHLTNSGGCWESLDAVSDVGFQIVTSGPEYQDFLAQPKIKVKLSWSSEPIKSIVHIQPGLESNVDSSCNKENNRPDSVPLSRLNFDNSLSSSTHNGNNNTGSTSFGGGASVTTTSGGGGASSNSHTPHHDTNNKTKRIEKIVYQFVYNNNSRQQTTACEDFKCPWCRLDCRYLYSLIKHLKYCHPRFKFTYHAMLNGALIDVAINSSFNKSFIGAPHTNIALPNMDEPFSLRSQPKQRCIGSEILVYYPRRSHNYSMTEFLNEMDDNENDGQRPVVSGHNRLYHHTITCLPVQPKEMDRDSDDEKDPKWLQTKTKMMIDEFTDVNEGEKELMKMWNLHVMKYGFVGDCQIPLACSMFLENNGKELLKRNLYRNFVLHLCNMFDFGLISGLTVYTTIQRLQDLIQEGDNAEYSQVLKNSCEAQRKYWIQEGSKKAPKLLEIRMPLSSPTGDGMRRKPGNYSPSAHSPNFASSGSSSASSSAAATSSATLQSSTTSSNDKKKLPLSSEPSAKRKPSFDAHHHYSSSHNHPHRTATSNKLNEKLPSSVVNGSSTANSSASNNSQTSAVVSGTGVNGSSTSSSGPNESTKSNTNSRTENSRRKSMDTNLRRKKRVSSLDDKSGGGESLFASAKKKRRISSPDLKMATNVRVVLGGGGGSGDATEKATVSKGVGMDKKSLDGGGSLGSSSSSGGVTAGANKISRTRNSLNGNGNSGAGIGAVSGRRKSVSASIAAASLAGGVTSNSTTNGSGETSGSADVKKSSNLMSGASTAGSGTSTADLRRKSDLIETLSSSSGSSKSSSNL